MFWSYWDNKQSQAQYDWCKIQMAFRLARWPWEFLGTTWSNKSDANLPGVDTKLPGGDNPWSLLFSSSIQRIRKKIDKTSEPSEAEQFQSSLLQSWVQSSFTRLSQIAPTQLGTITSEYTNQHNSIVAKKLPLHCTIYTFCKDVGFKLN